MSHPGGIWPCHCQHLGLGILLTLRSRLQMSALTVLCPAAALVGRSLLQEFFTLTNLSLLERDPLSYRRWPARAQHPCVAVQDYDTCRDPSPRVTCFGCKRGTPVPLCRLATLVASLFLAAPAPLDLCREGLAVSGWSCRSLRRRSLQSHTVAPRYYLGKATT